MVDSIVISIQTIQTLESFERNEDSEHEVYSLFALFHVIINRLLLTDIGLLMMRCAHHIQILHRSSNIDTMAIRCSHCEIVIHNILLMNTCTLNIVLSVLWFTGERNVFLLVISARRIVISLIVLGLV